MEEARFVLKEPGVNVCSPALADEMSGSPTAILIFADGAEAETIRSIERELFPELPIFVLQEKGVRCDERMKHPSLTKATFVDDFTTAIYGVAWAALELAHQGN
jgi:hypothetical protein